MDLVASTYYTHRFEIAFLRANGTEFQGLFSRIMQGGHKGDFIAVTPYGKDGDLKCDGWMKSTKTVFQVYAPSEMKQAKLLTKIRTDFDGAKDHWKAEMLGWTFVHNARNGLPPYAVKLLESIEEENTHLHIGIWGEAELRAKVFQLEAPDLLSLFGAAPTSETFENLEFATLEPVVEALTRSRPDPFAETRAPSVEKITANRLSLARAELLTIGRRREALVESYFNSTSSPELGDEIAEEIKVRYRALKAAHMQPDDIFDRLYIAVGGSDSLPLYRQAAALAVLSYFFERCDIFEDATSTRGGAVR